jgi:hypothetical protein
MNQERRDPIRQAWDETPPPEICPEEWDRVWDDMVCSLRQGRAAVPRPSRFRWLAYAATFLLGVGIGAAGARFPVSRDASLPADVPPFTATQPSESAEAPQPEGVELWGLRDVKVKALDPSEEGTRRYRLEGETARGIKVVYVYPAEVPVKPSQRGDQ